jgi:hypothetical protein
LQYQDVSSETDEYDEEDIVTEGEQNDLEDQDKPLGLFIPRGKNTSGFGSRNFMVSTLYFSFFLSRKV